MPDFINALKNSEAMITDGGIETRIKYETTLKMDPDLEVARLVYDPAGKEALTKIYQSYMNVGYEFNLPILIGTPTFRANLARIQKAGFKKPDDIIKINHDCVRLQTDLRKSYGAYANKIFIAGVIGPKNDAYQPEEALSVEDAYEYHLHQVNAFASSDVDFLFAPTFPALSEAMGVAKAMSTSKLPYVVSFVITAAGTLLDDTNIATAIEMIDTEINPRPAFYSLSCIHPSICDQAMQHHANAAIAGKRLLEIKANTSIKPPSELVQLTHLESEAPQQYAEEMLALKKKYGFKILGGCCGTNQEHIYYLAKLLTNS